ncbi:MAG: hypothetical protein J7M29_05065 [Verrucomicrobia bacterium]|nr:hypothetical protein [Verrucomicrobiota bacterium]
MKRVLLAMWRVIGPAAVAVPLAAAGMAPVLESSRIQLLLDAASGGYAVLDKAAGVLWRSNPYAARFGEAVLETDKGPRATALSRPRVAREPNRLRLEFGPWPEAKEAGRVRVAIRLLPDGETLEVSWSAEAPGKVRSVRLLDRAFWADDAGPGGALVPVREGLWIPSNNRRAFSRGFDTYAYEGCHMAMAGMRRRGAALLLSWDDPYTLLEIESRTNGLPAGLRVRQIVAPSLILRASARSFRARFLGKGDWTAVAKAYRKRAQAKGLRTTWSEKIRERPSRRRLFGAINFKLWSLLSRRMDEASRRELSKRVNWTFEEAAQVAAHLKEDLKLDKVLFLMGGWIHRGYDNQHPDILPAAPECGGDHGLRECARRVRSLGFLFGLHDNYQDMYRDAPSWNEAWIMKRPDGSLAKGGRWAGGRAYLICSRVALDLARRPQNLPGVKALTDADAYFIDTTYAAGLQECYDPRHPLTRLDDMKWKAALSDYARGLFGIFGSEDGREWAAPHADFFEGLAGVSGRHFHNARLIDETGGAPVPLFEAVYHDCVAVYGKYGFDPARAADYVLWHILLARPLHYHSVPAHLYWQERNYGDRGAAQAEPAGFEALGDRRFRLTYRWKASRPVSKDYRVFVHFTDKTGKILFQDDHAPPRPASQWLPGRVIEETREVRAPEAAGDAFEIRIGLFDPRSGRRAALAGKGRLDGEDRLRLGRVTLRNGAAAFEPLAPRGPAEDAEAVFVRGEGGWAAGLHPFDRFVKNTYEILSPWNELTAMQLLESCRFLTPDGRVRESRFGRGENAGRAVINQGPGDWVCASRLGGKVVLPPKGFLIETPTFIAFYARSWGGLRYADPPLFTIRSLDGKPLGRAAKVRVFHGFGDPRLAWRGGARRIPREAVLTPRSAKTPYN